MTDDQAVAAFEALLKTQVGPSAPWAPVTDYTYDARVDVEGKTPDLLISTFNAKNILDAGCGFGHLVRLLIERGADARGFDLQQRRDWLESPRFTTGDLTKKRSLPDRKFELVICREVLEHLTVKDIRDAVSNLCSLTSKYVYVTTRFADAPAHILDVQTSDGLDPTHISMLPKELLRTLFVLEGFTRRADLEALMDWRGLNRVLVYQR
jgi:SAM-dependent methyltransferase